MRGVHKEVAAALAQQASTSRAVDAQNHAVLRVRELSYSYGKVSVFADVSFALRAGEIAFLTGPNGAGKSTLLRVLAGWDTPRDGEVELCGRSFDGANRAQRAQLAFVPDTPAFYDDLTAGEHLEFVRRANRIPHEAPSTNRLMEMFGLAACRDLLPSSYSRGMRQKLALVLALFRAPRLLLLDEPYGPLDPTASATLSALLDEAHTAGTAVLVSCHHDVPHLYPNVLLHLKDGQLAVRRVHEGVHEESEGLAREGVGLARESTPLSEDGASDDASAICTQDKG